jgi:DNA-binding IclR family transcriptional regulator
MANKSAVPTIRKADAGEEAEAGQGIGDQKVTAAENIVLVKPAANAIRILKYLAESGGPTRSVTISRSLHINASTCFNILRTLVVEGVVDFDQVTKTYSVGAGLTNLIGSLLTEGQRVAAATPHMRDIAARYSVTVTLWKRLGVDKIVLVKSEASPTDLRIEMAEGQRLPVLMASTGRILAPHLGWSRKDLKAAFKALRWQTPLTFEEFWAQVEIAQKRGWASDQGYFTRGVQTIAAPVFDRTGEVAFTIVAVMLMGQHDEAGIAEIGKVLKEAAERLTSALT